MTNFESFSNALLEQAKRFVEKAKIEKNEQAISAYLNSSLLLFVSSLEAYINGIADDFSSSPQFDLVEKAFLAEKEIELDNGKFIISKRLRMSRLIERIMLISSKFDEGKNIKSEWWWSSLVSGISLRNEIGHPKRDTILKLEQIETSGSAIIECINYLFTKIYHKGLPTYGMGLQSQFDF